MILAFGLFISCSDDDDDSNNSEEPLGAEFNGTYMSQKVDCEIEKPSTVDVATSLYTKGGDVKEIKDSVLKMSEIYYSDRECSKPVLFESVSVKVVKTGEYKGAQIVREGDIVAMGFAFLSADIVKGANQQEFLGEKDYVQGKLYAISEELIKAVNEEANNEDKKYVLMQLIDNKLYHGDYDPSKGDSNPLATDDPEPPNVKVGTEVYKGTYVTECLAVPGTPGTSEIRQMDITDTQSILTITEYSYEGNTPTCDEAKAKSRIKAVRDYAQVDFVLYMPFVTLTVVNSTLTPLTEEQAEYYRSVSSYGYNDWILNGEKTISKGNGSSVHLLKLEGNRLITGMWEPNTEFFLGLYSYTKK